MAGQTASPAPLAGGITQPTGPAAVQAEVERVIVTGSNIPSAEEVGPNPVLAVNRDLIEKSGERQTAELLRDLPVANANGVPVSNNANGFTPGAAAVSLRGFLPSATLVLIDGRRVAPYPIGLGTQSFQDLFTIPLPAVQSIEILKDGASTTYGADAVAGVVNLKLWKDYRGTQVTLQYGNTLDKDAAIYSGDILFGMGDGKTSISGDVFFYHHNSLFNRDRGNSANLSFPSTNSSPINLQLSEAVVLAAGVPGLDVPPGFTLVSGHSPFFSNGLAAARDYVYTPPFFPSSGFNFNQFSGSYPEQERYGGYASFNHKICEDELQIYGDFSYTKVKTHNELAPAATGSFFAPGQVTIAIPPHMPLNGIAPPNTPRFAGEANSGINQNRGENPTAVEANAFNPFNPFNQIISGGTQARLAEFGNRIEDNTSNAYLATLGLNGDKLFNGTWGYDAGFRYSEIENDGTTRMVSISRFNRILNATDPIFNPNSDQFIGTTTPYNPFGDYRVPIPSNFATVNFATVHPKDIDISKITELDVNIYTTELFKLPAGGVGLAFGGQFRRESIEQDPDTLELQGDIVGVGPSAITHAGRKDYALYAEARVPLFGPEMGIAGLHSVEVTGAFRFEEFLNNGTNGLVPKVGLRWQPFDEQLTIRSTWGEGFREPSLFESYQAPIRLLEFTQFNGVINRETPLVLASNAHLQPDDSRTWTGGVVYTPKWLPWGTLTLSLDLWDIERTGVVLAPGPQEVVNRFAHGALLPGEVVKLDPDTGGVAFIRTEFQNGARANGRGADLGLQYQIQTQFGTFTVLSQWAYLDQFVRQPTIVSKSRNVVAQGSDDGFLRWKAESRFDWAWHNFDLNLTWHYLGGFREIIKNALAENGFAFASSFPNDVHEHWIHPTNFIDGQVSYSLIFTPPVEQQPVAGYSKSGNEVATSKDGKAVESTVAYSMPCWQTILNNSTITIACNNIFGQDPPRQFGLFFGSGTNYPGNIYDNTGRFWYVELKKKF